MKGKDNKRDGKNKILKVFHDVALTRGAVFLFVECYGAVLINNFGESYGAVRCHFGFGFSCDAVRCGLTSYGAVWFGKNS